MDTKIIFNGRLIRSLVDMLGSVRSSFINPEIVALKNRFENIGYYRACLSENPELMLLPLEERIDAVSENAVTNESYLFRYPNMFEYLSKIVLPALGDGNKSFASVGCSKGQEVYSVIMKLIEEDQLSRFDVHGYDINAENLAIAKSGGPYFEYRPNIKGYVLSQVLSGGIKEDDTGRIVSVYNATDRARSIADFRKHDILKGPLPERYDVIFLSQLLWHYSNGSRRNIMYNISTSLNEGGFLITSPVKSLSHKFVGERNSSYTLFMHSLDRFGLKMFSNDEILNSLGLPQDTLRYKDALGIYRKTDKK